jgi:hypothetical protein
VNHVASFNEFTSDNDPYGEHDFAAFDLDGERFNFKIDYYAPENAVEMRVFWRAPGPPKGRYGNAVHLFDKCQPEDLYRYQAYNEEQNSENSWENPVLHNKVQ